MRDPFHTMAAALLAAILSGCQSMPTLTPVASGDPALQRITQMLAKQSHLEGRWSGQATLQLAGKKFTGPAILDYHGPRDFRLIIRSSDGSVLLDGMVNWAGATVFHTASSIKKPAAAALLTQLSLALEPPPNIKNAMEAEGLIILRQTRGDSHDYTWIFDEESGYWRRTEIEFGLWDVLRLEVPANDELGQPAAIMLTRPARQEGLSLTFPVPDPSSGGGTEPSRGVKGNDSGHNPENQTP